MPNVVATERATSWREGHISTPWEGRFVESAAACVNVAHNAAGTVEREPTDRRAKHNDVTRREGRSGAEMLRLEEAKPQRRSGPSSESKAGDTRPNHPYAKLSRQYPVDEDTARASRASARWNERDACRLANSSTTWRSLRCWTMEGIETFSSRLEP
jgi:hypothetical protein